MLPLIKRTLDQNINFSLPRFSPVIGAVLLGFKSLDMDITREEFKYFEFIEKRIGLS
jgi:hypothetical protein